MAPKSSYVCIIIFIIMRWRANEGEKLNHHVIYYIIINNGKRKLMAGAIK